jgi:hypothetical protein
MGPEIKNGKFWPQKKESRLMQLKNSLSQKYTERLFFNKLYHRLHGHGQRILPGKIASGRHLKGVIAVRNYQ